MDVGSRGVLSPDEESALVMLLFYPRPVSTRDLGNRLDPGLSTSAAYALGNRVFKSLREGEAVALASHGHYVLTERGRLALALILARDPVRRERLLAGVNGGTSLFEGALFADYHQFYIIDEAVPPAALAWDDDAVEKRVNLGHCQAVFSTERNVSVPVSVRLHPDRPFLDLDPIDHAVGFSILCISGKLAIAGCTDYLPDAARLRVPTGWLAGLATFQGLGTIDAPGLEGDDRYGIHLWPAAVGEPLIVQKRWAGA